MNLRRLLAAVQAESNRLSEPARASLAQALDVVQTALPTTAQAASAGTLFSFSESDSPRRLLGHALRALLVGTTADRLEALLSGLGDGRDAPRVTFARDAPGARRLLERKSFDLLIQEYKGCEPSQLSELERLRTLPTCPPLILVAGGGSEALATAAFKAGVSDYLPEHELTPFNLRRSVLQALRRRRLEQELESAQARLAELANRDPLTDLHNRRHFENRLAIEFARAHRFAEPLALILLDVDHFKEVNDRFGHPTGDRVLIKVGNVLRALSRRIDLAARIGGEEFALLLPNTGAPGAEALAERVIARIREARIESEGDRVRVTVSAGVTAFPDCGAQTRRQLVECADRALYRAKEAGRNRIGRHRDLS
jgi:diguanylate cyclase (GGDEF)-like protein